MAWGADDDVDFVHRGVVSFYLSGDLATVEGQIHPLTRSQHDRVDRLEARAYQLRLTKYTDRPSVVEPHGILRFANPAVILCALDCMYHCRVKKSFLHWGNYPGPYNRPFSQPFACRHVL